MSINLISIIIINQLRIAMKTLTMMIKALCIKSGISAQRVVGLLIER